MMYVLHVLINYWVSLLIHIHVHYILYSIGEVGWKLGTQTLHTATPHAPGTATTDKDSDKGGERKGPDMPVGVELEEEEADIGENRSTSTLVNEDSVLLTPTQSSSPLSAAVTLTEISQMEGTQSTYTVQLKEDKPQKELTATNEATSQLTLKLDEHANGDELRTKLLTTTESATSQRLADVKTAGSRDSVNGDSVNGDSGDGRGGVEREDRGEEAEEGGVELSERLGGIDADNRQSPVPDTNAVIGDIVRSEMKKILEVHCTCI
jgi:hypothetical protein